LKEEEKEEKKERKKSRRKRYVHATVNGGDARSRV
jgi:hypothetical protein